MIITGAVLLLLIIAAALTPDDENDAATSGDETTTTAPEDDDEDTTTTEEETTTTEPPTTTTTLPGFDEGTQLVGTDVQPGRYMVTGASGCYWERLSGISGDFEEIITNGNVEGQAIVEILASDKAFNSTGCGRWTVFVPGDQVTSFGGGDWAVNEQIPPGTYRADANDGCYWERATGFTHNFDEIAANDNPAGDPIVEIAPGDKRFTNSGCGTWTKV